MNRAVFLGRLQAELRQAEWCSEEQRAAELRAQITRMSAGSAQSPARETTGRQPAGKSRS